MNAISKNFELRYVSSDSRADGETDFKGETSTLTTDERVRYLNEYARRIPEYVHDFSLDREIVPLDEAKKRLGEIKPQPKPVIRKQIGLQEWKWTGWREGQESKPEPCQSGETSIVPQDWRCFIEWELADSAKYENCGFSFGSAAAVGFDGQGQPYYISAGAMHEVKTSITARKVKLEVDFVYRKYNFYVNGNLLADFVDFSDTGTELVSSFAVKNPDNTPLVAKVWGVGYHRRDGDAYEPYTIETFIDLGRQGPVCMNGWNKQGFDEQGWETGVLPIVHGGERYEGQDIYMRKEIDVDEVPPLARLTLESLTPGGEVYVNGRLAAFIQNECRHQIDVTKYLKPGKNLLAVRVYAYKVAERDKMTHTHTDLNTGWFAGRMHLDLLPEIYIEDVFSWTDSLSESSAVQKVEVSVRAARGMASKAAAVHEVRARISPWFPEEGAPCQEAAWQTKTVPNLLEITQGELRVVLPKLWTPKTPVLYKLDVQLVNPEGKVVDDLPVTVGLRTVSQDGGVFRINGEPELLRAPLVFGARPPLDKIAAWEKCPPAEFLVQEMLMVQKMNGNGLRMSVHDSRIGGINDPRICEIADQMGIMLAWQTTTWLRITCASNLNLDELAECIREVRNHCSIVIWQPTNHPSWKNWDVAMEVYQLLYDTIMKEDHTRLISPSADFRRMYARFDDGLTDFYGKPCESCAPIWTAKNICRGNMDYILGYGNNWSALRQWPEVEEKNLPIYMESTAYIRSFIESPERAYFNFEHDEIIGQPNWNVHKGKPSYRLDSYEKSYEEGSIGRPLSHDEWLTSQSWQALGAYETVCKCRWLDYDGLCWCNLRGGQNTVTYQKSLVDYYGQPKLAFYAHQLCFQDVLACSGNVDMVYGPGDTVPVIVMNIGGEKTVNVTVEVISQSDEVVRQFNFNDIRLPAGRTVTQAANVSLPDLADGLYTLQYTVWQ